MSGDSAYPLERISVAQIVTFWRPGSGDWTWRDEILRLYSPPLVEGTLRIVQRIHAEGIGFADDLAPVTLANDGRVWDGHHRICIAIVEKFHILNCDVIPPKPRDEVHQ